MFLHPQTFIHTSTMPAVCITPPCKLNHYLPRLRTTHIPLQPVFHLYLLHYIYSLYTTKLHQLCEVYTIALKVQPSSFLQGSSKMASPTTSPCAACKFLRRKCQPECVFAPYFPPDQPAKFANVHKVFGASNVTKLLNELHPHQREDAVNSLAYEADMRLRDPVYGCVGVISILQHQLRQLQMDLTCAKSELSKYQSLGLITGGPGGGSAVGIGLGREQFFGGAGRHDHHQQMVMRSYDVEMARLGAYDAGLLAVNMSPAGIGTLAPLSQQPRAGGDDRLCMGPS